MSEFFLNPTLGCRLKYKDHLNRDWNIVVGVATTGIGFYFVVLLETEDGYRQLGMAIDGPWFTENDMRNALLGVPGTNGNAIGRYLISKMPTIQARLNEEFDPTPSIPSDWNAAPINVRNVNLALDQFFKLIPDPTGANAPAFALK